MNVQAVLIATAVVAAVGVAIAVLLSIAEKALETTAARAAMPGATRLQALS